MANTVKHKIEGKFRQGLIDYCDIPLSVRKKWSRHNFEVGYFRTLRNKIKESQSDNDMVSEINIIFIS
jgi:hypothetical protein